MNKKASLYFEQTHNFLHFASKDNQYILLNNHVACLVVLAKYQEAMEIVMNLIEKLESDVLAF